MSVTPKPAASSTRCPAWCTSRCHASITHPVNRYTRRPPIPVCVGFPCAVVRKFDANVDGRCRRVRARRGIERGETEAVRDEVEALRHAERDDPARRSGGGRAARAPAAASGGDAPDRRAPRASAPSGGRTGTPTGHAGSHPRHCTHVSNDATHLVGERGVVYCTSRMRRDAAPGRHGLVAGHPERRAVRQAQPALHAGVQLVVVDAEIHQSYRSSATTGRGQGSGGRSGRSRPSSARAELAGSASGPGAAGCGAVANTMPTPTDATNGPRRPPGRASPERRRGGSDHRCGGSGRRAGRSRPNAPIRPSTASLGLDVGAVTLELHPRAWRRPTARPSSVVAARRGHGERIGVVGRQPHATSAGSGWSAGSPRRAARACRASRPAVAGRSNPVTFFTVGPPPVTTRPSAETYRTCSTPTRERAPAEHVDVVLADRHAPRRPCRRARTSACAVPASRERVMQLGDRRAGADPHGHLLRARRSRCPPAPARSACPSIEDHRGPSVCRRPRTATGPSAPTSSANACSTDRRRRAWRAASSPHPRRHAAQRLDVGAAVADGQDLAGVRAARRDRTPGAGGSGGRGRRRRTSAPCTACFSTPMPCSPDSTPPASSEAVMISAPAACTRSSTPGSRPSNSSSGCRLPSPAWNTFITISS